VSHLVIDDLSDLAAWQALTPTGGASTAIAIEPGAGPRPLERGMTIRATTDAENHRVERALAPTDVTPFADLELWVESDRAADSSDARPLFLELRLGSAALAIGAPGNPWHRLIPIATADTWQFVALALDDLPAAVRDAVTSIRFTCVDASVPFVVGLGSLRAVSAQLLSDIDAALLERIANKLELNDKPVPAVVEPEAEPDQPFLRLRNYAVRPAPERSPSSGTRTDYTESGFSIRPASVPFDLFYAIEAAAGTRADAAAMLEFALAEFTPRSTLDVAGRQLTVEWADPPQLALPAIQGQPSVYLRVSTSQRALAARDAAAPPFNRVDVEVDSRATA
jgi:hypothetical protein